MSINIVSTEQYVNEVKEEILELIKPSQNTKTQSDWNQNDETASDYVKNRTHYVYEGKVADEVLFDSDVSYAKYNGLATLNFPTALPIIEGNEYLVQFEDKSVIVTYGTTTPIPGNEETIGSSIDFRNNQISVWYYGTLLVPDISHLKISTIKVADVVVPLDDKFVPDTVLRFEIEETLELPDESTTEVEVTDDGNGNVTLKLNGMDIIDDGNGNVTLKLNGMDIIDDGNGNVTLKLNGMDITDGDDKSESMEVIDDDNGNVTLKLNGIDIIDDNNGNVTIKSENMEVTDDGNGNVKINI